MNCAAVRLVTALIACCVLVGCGGKIATTGIAAVTQLGPPPTILVRYENGEAKWRRLERDNEKKHASKLVENLGLPARYVETKQGGTLTFPNGDTIIYQPIPEK
jgi:hypothetical protein